jgi:hypothetical protein
MFGRNGWALKRQRIRLLLLATIPLTLALLAAGVCSDSKETVESQQTQGPSLSPSTAATATPSPVDTASATPAPTAAPIDVSGWPTYKSEKWGYEIKYPPDWYDLSNFGAPDVDKYFANQYVSSVEELTKGGLIAVIRLSTSPYPSCASANLQFGTVIKQDAIEAAGASSTRYVLEDQPRVVFNVETRDTCYEIYFVITDPGTRDANLPLIDAMLGTFELTK